MISLDGEVTLGASRGTVALVAVTMLVLAASADGAPRGSTLLVSRPDGSGPAPAAIDGPSFGGALSDDGRYAAFISAAPLAAGADPLLENVFVRDSINGTTKLVSRSDGAAGTTANADADGELAVAVEPGAQALDPPHDQPHVLVAFATKATNLSDHVTGPAATSGVQEIWLRDVTAGTTYLVSRGTGTTGAPGNGSSRQPSLAIASSGPVVAFTSTATSLGTSGADVYLRTVYSGATRHVSCHQQNCGAGGSAGFAGDPSVRFVTHSVPSLCSIGFNCVLVAFATDDGTITGDATPNREHVVVAGWTEGPVAGAAFDRWVTASKADASGTTFGNDNAFNPSLSPDGLAVAFVSRATNLGTAPPTGLSEIFMRALDGSGSTALVSRGGAGAPAADGGAFDASLGGDSTHRRVAFSAVATNFGVTDPFGIPHAWARDLAAGTTELLDRAAGASGAVGDGESSQFGISADGKLALFGSNAHNLGGGSFNRDYTRHLDTQAVDVVSRPDGAGPLPPAVHSSTITRSVVSADGRYVAFQSNSDRLATGEDTRFQGVFVRDLLAGTTTLVSRASGAGGVAANADSVLNGISDNGRRVLFTTSADNLVGGPAADRPYVRDLDAQTTTVVSRANGPAETITFGRGAAISGDGNRVAFITNVVLDPDAGGGLQHLYVRDLAAHTTTFIDRDSGARGSAASANAVDAVLDRDGGRVAWTTTASLTGFFPPFVHVYMRDLRANKTELVSRAQGPGGAAANADASAPSIDAAGDVVAFQSAATDLGAPVNGQAVWVRDVAGGHLQLASRATGATGAVPDAAASAPSLDGAGDRVAFRSSAGNLVTGAPASVNDSQAYVRDLPSQTTELVSRANGPAGAPVDFPGLGSVSLSANGDCVAFDARGLNLRDGFASATFSAVHLRVLRRECPANPPDTMITSGPSGTTRVDTATFRFTASARPVTFECRLDGKAFGACTSPLRIARLRDGSHRFEVRGVDQAGYSDPTPAARSFKVDTRPPALSGLKLVPKRFAVAPLKPPRKRKHRRTPLGTSIRFRLSFAARVTFTVTQPRPGRKSGKRCLPARGKVPRGKRCTRFVKAGSFARNVKGGSDRVPFSGRIGKHALGLRSYRLTALPVDTKHHRRGRGRIASFTVIRPR